MWRVATFVVGLTVAVAGAAVAGDPSVDRARKDVEAGAAVDVARRVEALGVLATLDRGADRDRVLPAVFASLEDGSPDVRAAAASTAAKWRDPRAVAPILDRLRRENDDATGAALALAVGGIGARESADTLAAVCLGRSIRLRAALATALGDLGGERAHEQLRSLLAVPGNDPQWAVRGAAMLALARCGTREDAGMILVTYRDGGGADQWFARAALAEAVAALDSDPVPTLSRLIADADPRVASAAAVAFVRAGRPQEVIARLTDPRAPVRAAAAAAIADGGLSKEASRLVALAVNDPDRGVRWSAALALSRLDHPASDALLVEGVGADDPQVWATAIGECRRKTGLAIGRDALAWEKALADRRKSLAR